MKSINNISKNITSKQFFLMSLGVLVVSFGLLVTTLIIQLKSEQAKVLKPGFAYSQNQDISSGDVTVKVSNVSFDDGKSPLTAPSGKHYVVLDLSVTNRSDKPIQVLPSSDTYLKNKVGDISFLSPFTLSQPFRAGELGPSETIHGQLSYLVSKTDTVSMIIDAKWSGSAIPIQIQEENN